MNFVVNARDAMPSGGELTIASSRVELTMPEAEPLGLEPGGYLRLDVTDTGTGMVHDVAAHVFEPFFTTKSVGKGSGLGLSTVYGIVTQSEGRVAVSSSPGSGTTFTVHLPIAVARHDAPAVLLLEEEDAVRVLTREVLERNGYRVVEARDPRRRGRGGRRARVPRSAHHGGRRAGHLRPGPCRPAPPPLAATRVLYVSGYADVDIVPSLGSGASSPSLAKPFDPDQLLRSVRATLGASPRP